MTKEERKEFERFVKYFGKCWTERQKAELTMTLDEHMKYLDSLPKKDLPRHEESGKISWSEVLRNYESAEQEAIDAEYLRLKEGTEEVEGVDLKKTMDDQEYKYWSDSIRLTKQKEKLMTEEFKARFRVLSQYRVIIHREILIHLLFFLGYSKEEIYLPGTNLLNWKKVRTLLDDEHFFSRIDAYDHKGAKPEKLKPYATLNYIISKIGGVKQKEIDAYNMGFGRIFQWFKQIINVRKQDIMLRKTKRWRKRESRKSLMEKHSEWEEAKTTYIDGKQEEWE